MGKGAFYIKNSAEQDFMTRVCNAVSAGVQMSLTEKPGTYGPLRVDFDFKAPIETGGERLYTEKHLTSVVKIYQDLIYEMVDSEYFEVDLLHCIVLEKRAPRIEGDIVKDGFHLHFPKFIVCAETMDQYLREKVNQKMIEDGVWNNTGYETPVNKMIDVDIGTKVWMMYGSMNWKGEESTPYSYNRRQANSVNEKGEPVVDPWKNTPEDEQWGHAYDENREEIDIGDIFELEIVGRSRSVRYYLPALLTIRGYMNGTQLKNEVHSEITKLDVMKVIAKKSKYKVKTVYQGEETIQENIAAIRDGRLLEMLSDERISDYKSWWYLGCILYDITGGSDEGLQVFIEVSMRTANFQEGKCDEIWSKMEYRGRTIGALQKMAEQDSPDNYKFYRQTNIEYQLELAAKEVKCREYDIMKIVKAMKGSTLKCIDTKKDRWMLFTGHYWKEMDSGIEIKRVLVNEVLQLFREYKHRLTGIIQNGGGQQRNEAEFMEKNVSKIIDDLKCSPFHHKVVEMCKIEMFDDTFIKKANKNGMLVVCENGVLDLELGAFRDGSPDDYCTKSTGRHYIEYEERDAEVEYYREVITKIYPNKNIYNYWRDSMSNCLQSGNVHKRAYFFTGATNGGKSVIVQIMEAALGDDYMGKFPRELFMMGNRNNSGGPRAELMEMVDKKIMTTQELTHQNTIDIGLLKELTGGGDKISTRGQRGLKQEKIAPDATMIFQVNKPPKIPGDDAVWNRVRLILHESRFVAMGDKHPDGSLIIVPNSIKKQFEEKIFKADPNLKTRFDELASVMLWDFFHTFVHNKGKDILEPPEVIAPTLAYQKENDPLREFYESRVRKVPKDDITTKTFIKHADLFAAFQDWKGKYYPGLGKATTTSIDFKKEIAEKMGIITEKNKTYGLGAQNRWKGYRLLSEGEGEGDNDEEDDDV